MSATARIMGAAATAVLVIAPVAAAAPASAATVSHRDTVAMGFADIAGFGVGMIAEKDGVDGRSTRAIQTAVGILKTATAGSGLKITVTGLSDRNHDGLDDDAKLSVRVFDNVATVTLRKNRTHSLADAGFVFQNRRTVLKESAQSFDRILRLAASHGDDAWDMSGITFVKGEMPAGVRVVSDYDGNHDGYDDDGRITFLAGGKAVTLTIGNTPREVGKITYGPAWKTKAPKRTHHPVAPLTLAPAPLAKGMAPIK